LEKAREIKVKADEEFAIEKVRLPPCIGELAVWAEGRRPFRRLFLSWFIVCPSRWPTLSPAHRERSSVKKAPTSTPTLSERRSKPTLRRRCSSPFPPPSLLLLTLSFFRSAISNQNNKSRLQLLEKREELLEKVFEDARAKIGDVTGDEKKYAELLKKLVLQVRLHLRFLSLPFLSVVGKWAFNSGSSSHVLTVLFFPSQALYTLMEKDIKVSGRPKDQKLLETAAKDAAEEFEKNAGFKVHLEVNDELGDKSYVSVSSFSLSFLPRWRRIIHSAGGISIKGYNSRITVNNTLDERLRLLEERMLPEIRESLFGKNENRRFYS
jgi:vacuolar-type H+-ATPase subunit E/Vma4